MLCVQKAGRLDYCTVFLNRAWTICSSNEFVEKECDKLRKIFALNGYPRSFFNKVLDAFTDKKSTNLPLSQNDENELSFICKIPYVGKCSVIFANKLSNIIKEHYLIDIRCVYTSCKVREYFSLKCKTPQAVVSKSFTNSHVCMMQRHFTLVKRNDTLAPEPENILNLMQTNPLLLQIILEGVLDAKLET